MIEPLACCLHGVDVAGVEHGQTVAVVGLGPIGLMLCACVADAGGRPVAVGGREERRELAPRVRRGDRRRRGADVVIEAAGTGRGVAARARSSSARAAPSLFGGLPTRHARRGRPLPPPLRGADASRGAFHHTPRHVRAALAFLASGAYPCERLITHRGRPRGVAGLFADPPRDYLKAAVVP